MGCFIVIILFGLFGLDSAFFQVFGLWGLLLVAFELFVAWLIALYR